MITIYAEKHSLAKAIAEALGAGQRIASAGDKTVGHWEFTFNGEPAIICHGSGHLGELAGARDYGKQYIRWDLNAYPCIPDRFITKVSEHSSYCFGYVKQFFDKSDLIINAADPDREGELIFGYVYELAQYNKPWKRAWIEDLTPQKIRYAFGHLKDSAEVIPLQNAGRARAIADWLIGINLTIAMTVKFGGTERLNIGRVQTPTLALVVNVEKQIQSHKKTPFWKLSGEFSFQGGSFSGEYADGNLPKESEAKALLAKCTGQSATVTSKSVKHKTVSAPLLYNSTQLQIAASDKLGWDAVKAEKVMQSLYLAKYMSYPRTSSEHLTEAMKPEITETLEKLFNMPEYRQYVPNEWAAFTARHFDDSKVGSHPAITPTQNVPESLEKLEETLGEDERKLYDLLAKSLIRIVYPKAEEKDSALTLEVNGIPFKATGSTITVVGWYAVDCLPEKKKSIPDGILEGMVLPGDYSLEKGETKPPKRYTEATLLSAMELAGQNIEDEEARTLMKLQKKGLGTDATRVPTIKALYHHGLLTKKGKSVIPTEKEIFLINTLSVGELKSAEITCEWEKTLNDIAEGKTMPDSFLSEIRSLTTAWYEAIKNASGTMYIAGDDKSPICPFCGSPVHKYDWGYGCTGFKNGCKFSVNKTFLSADITEQHIRQLCDTGITEKIEGFVSKNTGKPFTASLKINRSKQSVEFEFGK
jgi:DNA topoisomerase-3